jgi:capsule polysaccharide export protein KpsC/LpsZ
MVYVENPEESIFLKTQAMVLSDKVDFKLKLVRRDKECHFILIKRTIH